jgi:hypothetical protein
MKTKFKQFINENRFTWLCGELLIAGKSIYPIGTKIKILII